MSGSSSHGGGGTSRGAKARSIGLGRKGKAPPIQDDLMKIMYGYGDDKQVRRKSKAVIHALEHQGIPCKSASYHPPPPPPHHHYQ